MSFQPSKKDVSWLVRKAVLLYYVMWSDWWLMIGPIIKKIGDWWVIEIMIFDKLLVSDWNHFFFVIVQHPGGIVLDEMSIY